MNQFSSTTPTPIRQSCPTGLISVELPLATVEELDNLAELTHITQQDLLRALITAALLNDTPHLPAGEDPIGRLAEHAYLTCERSLQIEAERGQA